MWPRKGREAQRSVRIRRAGNVPEIALATHDVAPAVRMEGQGKCCTINAKIEWCGKWAANWMQFKHLSLESERQTRLLVAAVCGSLGASCHGSLMASSSRAATLHLQHVCANSFCLLFPPSLHSLAATVNDHELRQRRSLCRSCSHDFMHYA